MKLTPLVLLLVGSMLASLAPGGAATVNRTVGCGGFGLPYGASIGSSGPSRTRQRVSSVIAVAAVTVVGASEPRVQGWMIWDERGMAWLGLKKNSPPALRRLWVFTVPPDFRGPGVQVRFTPIKSLPKAYELTDCPDARP